MAQSTDKLGRRRDPAQHEKLRAHQFTAPRPGALSRSHNVSMSSEAHEAFAALSPAERGALIEQALRERGE